VRDKTNKKNAEQEIETVQQVYVVTYVNIFKNLCHFVPNFAHFKFFLVAKIVSTLPTIGMIRIKKKK